MKLLPHRLARIFDPMDLPARSRPGYPRNSQIIRARRNDSPRRDLHPRPIENPLIKSVTYVDVPVSVSVRRKIAQRGKPGTQVGLSVSDRGERRSLFRSGQRIEGIVDVRV